MSLGDISRIGTNVQALSAHTQFTRTNNDLGVRQLRLATGSRLNRAEDDSAGYFIAKKLESKTRGQAQALSNIGDAKGMLTVGEGSLNSVMDILQTMKEKAVQAGNATMGASERTAIQSQMDALVSEINDTLNGAEFNGTALFGGDGSGGALDLNFQVGAESGDSFTVALGAMNADSLGLSGSAAEATIGGASAASIASASFSGAEDASLNLTIAEDNGDFSASYTDANGDTQTIALSANTEYTVGGFTFSTGGTLTAGAVELGGTAAVGGIDVGSHAGASAAIGSIDAAIASVSEALSGIGDAQSRLSFKEDNLQTSMNNYEASRSRIADTDFAKEQMEIVKLQILQQTGIASLAQANSAPQAVLSLIG